MWGSKTAYEFSDPKFKRNWKETYSDLSCSPKIFFVIPCNYYIYNSNKNVYLEQNMFINYSKYNYFFFTAKVLKLDAFV